jgi:hypothetical protein
MRALMGLFAAFAMAAGGGAWSRESSPEQPGCSHESARDCVEAALAAMGGHERLAQLKNVRLQIIGHTLLVEQSYRQAPFISSYERDTTTLDLANGRLVTEATLSWPENDNNQPDVATTLIVGPLGGVYRGKKADSPCSLDDLDVSHALLALGPSRVLLTALTASDLHFETPESVRSSLHAVVAFTWEKAPVRVLLNPFNHLPDAVETVRQLHDFWYFWGDVQQRVYFDNFKLLRGISYPTNIVEERNGIVWSSQQAVDVQFDVPLDDKTFAMDATVAAKSAAGHGWDRPFSAKNDTVLAPGIDLFIGSWNSTVIKQDDGIVILEAPISSLYTRGVIEEARKRYPGAAVKAILSTSDSWPHWGGVRYAVSQGFPVYILDLNRPLLDRMIEAPHTLVPDDLQTSRTRPKWQIVTSTETLGSGANRLELHPVRGASTERQYMVYFPAQKLLYASDTLVLNDDDSLYDPELMHEIALAVARDHLKVDTVFAMHQAPVAWSKVMTQIEKARSPG